jgi:hypothetical protein
MTHSTMKGIEEGLIENIDNTEKIFRYLLKKQMENYNSISDNELPAMDEDNKKLILVKNKNPDVIQKLVERIQDPNRDRIFTLKECIEFCYKKGISITFLRILLKHLFVCFLVCKNTNHPIQIKCYHTTKKEYHPVMTYEVLSKKMTLLENSDICGWKYSSIEGEHVFVTKIGLLVILNPKDNLQSQIEGLRWVFDNLINNDKSIICVGFCELEEKLKERCPTLVTMSLVIEIIRWMRYYFNQPQKETEHTAIIELSIDNRTIELTKVLSYSFISPFRMKWCENYRSESEVEWDDLMSGRLLTTIIADYVFYKLDGNSFVVYNQRRTTLTDAIAVPIIPGLSAYLEYHRCNWCNDIASKCCTCKKIYYCNPDCQKSDWKTHKIVFSHNQ